jgi:hypothetical protein
MECMTTKQKKPAPRKRKARPKRSAGQVETVALEELLADPSNVRLHSERNIEAIMASLVRFGQQKPIVVRLDGVVVAGNGTLEAARRMDWESIEVRWTDLEGAEAVAYSIADNRTAELAEWDEPALKAALGSLPDEARVGWDEDDLDSLGGEEDDGEGEATGELLNRLQHVFLDEPLTEVEHGEVWRMGQHIMIVADVVNDVALWRGLLTDGMLFCPYPGPFVALSSKAGKQTMLLVQPDRYVAGHVLDQYKAQHGEKKVTKD